MPPPVFLCFTRWTQDHRWSAFIADKRISESASPGFIGRPKVKVNNSPFAQINAKSLNDSTLFFITVLQVLKFLFQFLIARWHANYDTRRRR